MIQNTQNGTLEIGPDPYRGREAGGLELEELDKDDFIRTCFSRIKTTIQDCLSNTDHTKSIVEGWGIEVARGDELSERI